MYLPFHCEASFCNLRGARLRGMPELTCFFYSCYRVFTRACCTVTIDSSTAHNKPLAMTCFPDGSSYSCTWNIQSMSLCFLQQRKGLYVCMGATKYRMDSGSASSQTLLQFYLLTAKKNGKRNGSSDNGGEKKWDWNMEGKTRELSHLLPVVHSWKGSSHFYYINELNAYICIFKRMLLILYAAYSFSWE